MLWAVLEKSVRRRAVASAVPATRGRNYSAELAGVAGDPAVGIKLATKAVALQFTIRR